MSGRLVTVDSDTKHGLCFALTGRVRRLPYSAWKTRRSRRKVRIIILVFF